ncbi:hypothetical protein Tcan_13049 [Toxocara canis]|uniref:Uncharacterized protein n=1 Tax=Toxocara canis TaxID=6265 RepID=A0A0B2UWK4_TOXCA|nr:hypothetical protein Tcan_13049 [Toxocara canis]
MNGILVLFLFGTTFGLPMGYRTWNKFDFPETIWLGGLIPYKIDKAYERYVNKALSEGANSPSFLLINDNSNDVAPDTEHIYRKNGILDLKSLADTARYAGEEHHRKLRVHAPDRTAEDRPSEGFRSFNNGVSQMFPSFEQKIVPFHHGLNEFEHSGQVDPQSLGLRSEIITVKKSREEKPDELTEALDKELERILSILLDSGEQFTTAATPADNVATNKDKFILRKALRKLWL